ncbi:MAG: FAD-dependent oxidoreductase, partial [Solirubrobacteraceae bacterium]
HLEPPRLGARPRVLVAGAGVAGLETLLGLRALLGDRVEITLLAPELKFVNRSMSVTQPFTPQRVRGVRIESIALALGARWHRGILDRVESDHRRVVTRDGVSLSYEMLVLALGARPDREWLGREVLTFRGGRDSPDYRLLLRQLDEGRVRKVTFVRPGGPSWPLPVYDLALMTAARCSAPRRAGVELTLLTPEEEPLGIFGKTASAAVRLLLDECGVALHTNSYAVPGRSGSLDITPGNRRMKFDRVVTVPRLVGPRLRGIPCDSDGFIGTDGHGRVPGLDDVFAAGDATTFPIKQGGLAAQQADAVAEAIAAAVGVDLDPQPFHPILRAVLLTGGPERYLRADISGTAGDDSTISHDALWWPPVKLAGRYLAPFLASQVGEAADVMPSDTHAIPGETTMERLAPGEYRSQTLAIS